MLSTPNLTPDAVSISIASATAPTTAAPAIANRACDRVLPPRPAHTTPASVIAARAPYGFIAESPESPLPAGPTATKGSAEPLIRWRCGPARGARCA
jgi:hypothetical protein